jgi:hypothetical protein
MRLESKKPSAVTNNLAIISSMNAQGAFEANEKVISYNYLAGFHLYIEKKQKLMTNICLSLASVSVLF